MILLYYIIINYITLELNKIVNNCLQIWVVVMGQAEWNKKEELVADQALKHLKIYTPLFDVFTTTARSELALLLKVQEFCYENMNFMKVFQKIVLLFYKSTFIMLTHTFISNFSVCVHFLFNIFYFSGCNIRRSDFEVV